MSFKKFPRRVFLTADPALAFLHTPLACILSARQSVNINNYSPHDWIASFKQAFSEGQAVVVPGGLVRDNINTGIFIPPSKALHILGGSRGSGRGRFVLRDGNQVTGEEGGNMHNVTLDMRGSDCIVKGLTMNGFGSVTQIYIDDKNKRVMHNLTIDNLTVSHTNYAILRQGFHNQIIGVNITNYKFSDLQGDAIEWNATVNDRDILISDHVIRRISCTNGKINWGIDIGLAGNTYDNNYPEDQTARNSVVANIMGPDCRQLIHVKNGKRFVIHSIKVRNTAPDFSKRAGIDSAAIAIYGRGSLITGNIEMISSAGMLIDYGVIKGKYLSVPQNFRMDNIQLDSTHLAYKLHGIQVSAGNAISFMALTNTETKRASLELHNEPQHLFMHNINAMQESSVGLALNINSDTRRDARGVFMAKKETPLSPVNVHAVSKRGQGSVDINRIDHHIVSMEKINFRLSERRGQTRDHSWKNGVILRNNATAVHNEAA